MKPPARLQPLLDEGFIDEVLRQLMSGKEAIEAFARFGYPAVRKSVASMPFYAQQPPVNKLALERAMESAEPDPNSPDFMEIALDLVQPEIDEMLSDGLSPQGAAVKATRSADAFLKTQASRGEP